MTQTPHVITSTLAVYPLTARVLALQQLSFKNTDLKIDLKQLGDAPYFYAAEFALIRSIG